MQLLYSVSPDPNEEALELTTPTDPVVELLKQGAGKCHWSLPEEKWDKLWFYKN